VKQFVKMVNSPFLMILTIERISVTPDAFKKRTMIRQEAIPNAQLLVEAVEIHRRLRRHRVWWPSALDSRRFCSL